MPPPAVDGYRGSESAAHVNKQGIWRLTVIQEITGNKANLYCNVSGQNSANEHEEHIASDPHAISGAQAELLEPTFIHI